MNTLDQLTSQPLPPTLYHYTTQEGLLGIFEDQEIWASSSRYLNDTSEFKVGQEVARKVIAKKLHIEQDSRRTDFLKEMLEAVEDAGINVCVCSFSEIDDSLSQWRAYSNSGTGYSIGFDPNKIRSAGLAANYILVPCIYEDAPQQAMMNMLVEDVLSELLNPSDSDRAEAEEFGERMRGGNMAYYLNRYALTIKHPHFKAEAEWRLISKPKSFRRLRFRAGKSTIVPYDAISLEINGAMPLNEILVGPSPHTQDAAAAIRGLLITRYPVTARRPQVRISTVPFRNW